MIRSLVFVLTVIALFFITLKIHAQTFSPDLSAKENWKLFNRTAETINEKGYKGVFLNEAPDEGMMILENYKFSTGIIEVDIKGKDMMGQSFVGIAFYGQNDSYDAIYFRPFNFYNPDTIRRSRSVQYISMPQYPWESLREEWPGKYENKVRSVPDPNDWFHITIDFGEKEIKVFVNKEEKPSLVVEKLANIKNDAIGLWVGNNSSGAFANLKITPRH